MKVIFSLLFSFLSFTTLAIELDSLKFLNTGFNSVWSPNTVKLSLNGLVESNALNAGMYNDLLLRSQFSENHLNQFKENKNLRLNAITDFNANLDYILNPKRSLYASAKNEAAISSTREFASLLLFGNSEYVDQEIATTNLEFISSTNYTVGLKHRKQLNSGYVIVTTGVGYVSSYNQLTAASISVFTSSKDYIDFNVQDLEFNNHNSGMFLDLGFELEQETSSKSRIALSLQDIRPTILFKDNNRRISSETRFEGFEVDVINPSLNNLDSNLNDIFNVKSIQNGVVILPARARFSAYREIGDAELELSLRAIYAGFVGYAIEGNYLRSIGDRFAIKAGTGFGNFTGLYINASAELKIGNSTNAFVELQGLNSLAIPLAFSNYGLRLGISSRL